MTIRILTTIFLLSSVINSMADDSIPLSSDPLSVLLTAKSFSVEGTGFAGTASEETIAFRDIFRSPHARKYFQKILKSGTFEGKLYALSGFYFTDTSLYRQYIEKWSKSDIRVALFTGCKRQELPLRQIIVSNEKNVIRLSHSGENIGEWQRRNRGMEDFHLDFTGGGYPQKLKEYILDSEIKKP